MISVLFVDFSKAFDRVDHHILLTKCASLGLPNIFLMPTQTASEDRQCKIEVHYHQRRRATRNNIWPHWFYASYKWPTNNLWSDDCTVWESCAPSCANSSLQAAAYDVPQWTTTNKMILNYDKTKGHLL